MSGRTLESSAKAAVGEACFARDATSDSCPESETEPTAVEELILLGTKSTCGRSSRIVLAHPPVPICLEEPFFLVMFVFCSREAWLSAADKSWDERGLGLA